MEHSFNFPGGKELSKIGAGWFVSYAYYKNIDNGHKVWMRVRTCKVRIQWFEKIGVHYKELLQEVLSMGEEKLNTGTLGLGSIVIKQMALDLLKWQGGSVSSLAKFSL